MENVALVTIPKYLESRAFAVAQPGSRSPKLGKNSTLGKGADDPSMGVKFVSAGLAACTADLITFPLDTAKVRLQIQGEGTSVPTTPAVAARGSGVAVRSPGHLASSADAASARLPKYRGIAGTLCTVSREEGPRAMYNGLVPGLQRQMCFGCVRIGLYDSVKQFYLDLFQAEGTVGNNNIGLRILAGITTGGAAVLVAQPTDVVKVRMQAQGAGKARYTGCMNAYRTIAMTEGTRGLWKGTSPNVMRNSIVNACELVSYDLIKESLVKRQLMSDNMPCHFVSAFGAGFCTTVIASPVDVIKTRFMNSSPGQYRGALHCASVMAKEGGAKAFYKGFMPSFVRLGSWNIVMFVTFEQLKRSITQLRSDPSPIADLKKQLPKNSSRFI